MGYITKKNEIPSWFSPERYENIRSGDLQQVYDELTLRKMVHTDLNDKLFKSDSDRQSYFNKSLGENYDAKDPNESDCDKENNVRPIHVGDLVGMAGRLKEYGINRSNFFSQDNLAINKDVHQTDIGDYSFVDPQGVFVAVSLKQATNKEILAEMEILLEKLRTETQVKEPKRYNFDQKYKFLFSKKIFEYIDLTLWAKAYGHKFSEAKLEKFIQEGLDIENTRKHAKHVLSFEFLEQMKAELYQSLSV